ncbi:hypothetical protein [Rheinheimera sp.]|uniref:hypothetical protein n=1 Tax=Rheinheimera sp. TaxID=1869214 RepID=UPI0023559BEC|nr:hypothetical protein [Rheinheimera sp.]
MPITISVNEFKKKTSTTFGSRFVLEPVDSRLEAYHQCVARNTPHSEQVGGLLYGMLDFIQAWAQGKAVVYVNGKFRYKAYRDRYGYISELERQVKQTINELNRVHTDIQNNLAANLGRRFAPALPTPPNVVPFTDFGPNMLPRALRDSTESFDPSGLRPVSLDSFLSWDERSIAHPRSSVVSTQTMENMGMANPTLEENSAYQTAAVLIRLATRQMVQSDQIRNAAQQPKTLTGGVLTMGSLASAMNTFIRNARQEIYYERHCTQSQYFVNILKNSSEQNPVLFAVTDNANGPSKVIICRGRKLMFDGHRQWYRYNMVDPTLGIGKANMTMDEQGDMTVESHGQVAHYVAARELGFIKFEQYA